MHERDTHTANRISLSHRYLFIPDYCFFFRLIDDDDGARKFLLHDLYPFAFASGPTEWTWTTTTNEKLKKSNE